MKSHLILATVLSSLTLPLAAVATTSYSTDIPLIDTTPAINYAGNIDFMTGGVGEDERYEIESMKNRFNVHVTQARSDGAFVEDVKTIVSRKNGKEWNEILNINSGPLLYINLEPGTYMIESTRAGRDAKKQQFTVNGKTASKPIAFTWKPMMETIAPAAQ